MSQWSTYAELLKDMDIIRAFRPSGKGLISWRAQSHSFRWNLGPKVFKTHADCRAPNSDGKTACRSPKQEGVIAKMNMLERRVAELEGRL